VPSSKITVQLDVPATADRDQVRRAFNDAVKSCATRRPDRGYRKRPRPTAVEVDASVYDTLVEIAALAASLLKYTEQTAAAARPNEYISLVENLRKIPSLVQAEVGSGTVVDDLLEMLDVLES
jgi:hypothetical protein